MSAASRTQARLAAGRERARSSWGCKVQSRYASTPSSFPVLSAKRSTGAPNASRMQQ
jgi:hypothetical protein